MRIVRAETVARWASPVNFDMTADNFIPEIELGR
jgi:hypothetical protein